MKLKKGSKEAKAFMAKIRAKRGTTKKVTAKKLGATKKDIITYKVVQNKNFGDYRVQKYINNIFDNEIDKNLTKAQAEKIKKRFTTPKKVGSTLKLTPKENRLGATEKDYKTRSKSDSHKDTKSHNVNIRVVSGIGSLDFLHKEIMNTDMLIKNYERGIEGNNSYLKTITAPFEKNQVKKQTIFFKSKLAYYKKTLRELKKIYQKYNG